MSDLAARLMKLPPEKRAQLLQRLRGDAGPERAPEVQLVRHARGERFAASFQQEQLWFIDRLAHGQARNNVGSIFRLTGEVDLRALRAALADMVRRHEIFRTALREENGSLKQVVVPALVPELTVTDLESLPEEQREDEAMRICKQEAARPFDMAQAPLFRASLLTLNAGEHILLWVIHHVAWDATSLPVFVRELCALYVAHQRGEPSPLPDLTLQYGDFALWQRDYLTGTRLQELRQYWKDRLAGLEPTELPTDSPRPKQVRFEGSRVVRVIPSDVLTAVRELGHRNSATLYMTLLAAFKALVRRYTRQDDVVVGTPSANRIRPELEGLIGFFVNMIVLRTDLSGDPVFLDLLARVRETTFGAFDHQELPFEKVVEAVNPPRDPSRHPLFQIEFTVDPGGAGASTLQGGLAISHQLVHDSGSRFDMSVIAYESEGALAVAVEYNVNLYHAETIERMLASYERVLRAIVANPALHVSELPLLGEDEHHLLTEVWSRAPERPIPEGTLPELFEACAVASPDAVALRMGDTVLRYGELNRAANRLANLLRKRGVGTESRVGICMPRSTEMVVAVLAVLKAGGAYVPLDPGYPLERIRFILEDAEAVLVLTNRDLASRFTELADMALCPDCEEVELAAQQDENPVPAAEPRSLAYVLYTSGSTGQPKGVMIEHRSVVNFVEQIRAAYEITSADRLVQFASLGFDVSVFDLFTALLTGAELSIVSQEEQLSPELLTKLMQRYRITVAELPPRLLPLLSPSDFPDLRLLSVGGEAPAGEVVTAWQASHRKVWNGYGPTEATVAVSLMECRGVWDRTPPIGRPMPNHRALVLDENLQPVPIGVSGELLIGGVGVARGYLNRPDLTADRFIPDPFAAAEARGADSRLYKTGDLVRWLRDGTLEYMGRVDRQVKIRGFRIELGEVEAALAAVPGVREAVVQVHTDPERGPQLLSYLVPCSVPAPSTATVREFLARSLPNYMLPSRVVILERIPLTPHGKLDQRALPAPGTDMVEQHDSYEAPVGETEEQLANEVFAPVIGVSRVGRRDNFFNLGGNSLQGTQIVSRLRSIFGVEVSLADFFLAPTVVYMAELVERGRERRTQERDAFFAVLAGLEGKDGRNVPASNWQVRLWERWRRDPQGAMGIMPLTLRLRGKLFPDHLVHSLRQVVRRHNVLRTGFREEGSALVQVVDSTVELNVPTEDWSAMSADDRRTALRRAAAEEAIRPFDLTNPPLMRACLVKLASEEHALLLTFHHAIYDGWSGGVFFRELAEIYNAACDGRQTSLPEPRFQYADFARWQQEWLGSPERERQMRYWRERLEEAPTLKLLGESTGTGFDRGWLPIALSPGLSDRLKSLGARHGASLFMTLLTGFAMALRRVSSQTDLTIGTNIAGRSRTEWEEVIGMFANCLALRLDLSGDGGFTTLLGRVRRVAAEAYTHQDLPFGELLRELAPTQGPGRSPIFQAMFALQNTPGGGDSFSGIEEEVIRDESGPTVAPILEFYSPAPAFLDVSLAMSERVEGLMGTLEFNRHVLSQQDAERLAQEFAAVLQNVVECNM